jgi:hypothetical protein
MQNWLNAIAQNLIASVLYTLLLILVRPGSLHSVRRLANMGI